MVDKKRNCRCFNEDNSGTGVSVDEELAKMKAELGLGCAGK